MRQSLFNDLGAFRVLPVHGIGLNHRAVALSVGLHLLQQLLLKLSAPFIPFMTEEIYQNLVRSVDKNAPESVHLCDYPKFRSEHCADDIENEMYDYLCERLGKEGFEHYEVSNFALPGRESKHNSSYWDGTPYIGVGAGAHSYIGRVRSWNPNDLNAYISGTYKRESEILTEEDLYNESIMLGLRTKRGVLEPTTSQSRANYERLIADGLLNRTPEGRIVATQKGIHILNRIIEELMI